MGQVVIKPPDAEEVIVDGAGLEPLVQEVIDIGQDFDRRHLLQGHIQPHHKVLHTVQVIFNRVGRVVAPLEKAPEVHDRIDNGHGFPPFDPRHGPEVFLLPGSVRQPGVAPGHLQFGVAQQLLQTFQTQAGI